MNKIIKYCLLVFSIIAVFLIGLFIWHLIISYNLEDKTTSTKCNTDTLDLEISNYIPDNIKKIKISKFDTESELPFVCYISDNTQIKNFIDSFNDTELTEYNTNYAITPLYIIDFNGDSTITVQIFSDRILKVDNSNPKYFKLSNDDFLDIVNLTDVKYYLHDSNLEKPSESSCYNAQKTILSGLSDSEISTLRTEIHNIHMMLEFRLVDRINILKDANSIYWEPSTVDMVFTQPDGVKFQSNGFWEYRDALQNMLNLSLNDDIKKIINDILYSLQNGMDTHDLSQCFEAHKMLHDLDYWIINYPLQSFLAKPADWGGINCYYGLIEQYDL